MELSSTEMAKTWVGQVCGRRLGFVFGNVKLEKSSRHPKENVHLSAFNIECASSVSRVTGPPDIWLDERTRKVVQVLSEISMR